MLDQPTQYGPYLLLERIALGGMAEVFKAIEFGVEGFERFVAVKRILPHVAEDDEFIAMFKDEARIAVQLTHSNIAQIYNLGHEHDTFYIALQYVAGRDVRAIFERCRQQRRPMPTAQACFIVMQVCEGLDYAHNKKDKYGRHLNIIHRDVSPPNILVSYEGEVKLIDFGVAKAAGRASKTQAGILKGKFGYMSPEQVKGMPLDRRSDVFSLGVCLWELLTGHRLFQAESDFATLEMVRAVAVNPPRELNPDLPLELENIVMRGLTADPEQRYQSATELHDELQAFMFAHGLFYSRKDLAAWMRQQYAREIELEKEKAKQRPVPPQTPELQRRATIMMGPGGRPPPPPPGGRRPPPPPGGAESSAESPAGTRPPSLSPGGRPSAVPTQAHAAVPAAVLSGASAPPREMPKPGRTRAKTMVMSTSRPDLPTPGGARPPAPQARPRPAATTPVSTPVAATQAPARGKGDLEWDDDELETRLFEGEGEDASASSEPPSRTGTPEAMPSVASARPMSSMATAPQQTLPQALAAARAGGTGPQSLPLPHSLGGGRGSTSPQQVLPQMPIPQHAPARMPGRPHSLSSQQSTMPPSLSNMSMSASTTVDEIEFPKRGLPMPAVIGIGVIAMFAAGLGVFALTRGDSASVAAEPAGPVAAAVGTLTLELTPEDAQVLVDGKEFSGGSPRIVSNLGIGAHQLSVSKGEQFLAVQQDFAVASGQQISIPVKLHLRDVTLDIQTDPADVAVILVSGQENAALGNGARKHVLQRQAGVDYKLEGSAKGYQSVSVPIVFSGGAAETIQLSLVPGGGIAAVVQPVVEPPEPAEVGDGGGGSSQVKKTVKPKPKPKPEPKAKNSELKIGTGLGLPPAEVFVDGRKESKRTPVSVKVSAGNHSVKWKWDDGKTTTQSVSIGDGETKVVKGSK